VVIGIDFDNTIASYDELMHRLAVQWGWVGAGMSKNKKLIRDALRALPDGEAKWRRLQTHCYGPGMYDARPMEGAKEFIAGCKTRGVPVWVVSHKTEFANFGDPTVKLRAAALEWMAGQGFFSPEGLGVGRERVFFEETRERKIERIRSLGVSHFIDDLEETFLEPSFPSQVAQILYAPELSSGGGGTWRAFATWRDIQRHLLG
jgi:hypothetical protein